MLPPPNLPRSDLLEGNRKKYIKIGVPLNEAASRGDWKSAKTILDKHPELIRCAITENYETLLHIAGSAENTKSVEEFVENLVNLMEKKDLELQNKCYNTALSLAAASGNVKTAMIMVKKNRAMLETPDGNGMLPLYMAASFAKPDMVRYLYDNSQKMSGNFWTHENRGWVLQRCVEADIFDVSLRIVNDCTELIAMKGLLTDILLILAQKAHAFKGIKENIMTRIVKSIFHVKLGHAEKKSEALQLLRIIWQKIAIRPKNEIDEIVRGPSLEVKTQGGTIKVYPSHALFLAAKIGNTRFVVELLHSYPYLTLMVDDKGQTIFHIAVRRRHAMIYNLLYEIGFMKDLITPIKDRKGNNMLHLVAKSAKPKRYQNVLAVPVQMQLDATWFKEVEHMIPPNHRQMKNVDGETPYDLFTKKRRKTVTEFVDWMKRITPQCVWVAALVTTVAFLALRGGYNQDTGTQKPALIVFKISDAVTFICSLISTSMFIYIYAFQDLLESSVNKLMFGLATLFFSMLAIIIAFGAGFFLLYNKDIERPPIYIATLLVLLVIKLFRLEYRLLVGVVYSAYQSRNLFKPRKHMLYQ